MAGFIEEILSGRYPRIEALWRTEFGKVVDELLNPADLHKSKREAGDGIDVAVKADVERLEAVLAEEKKRHEATKRELDVTKRERASLRYQVDAIKHALKKTRHQEPL